jgi:hypothetical protein
MTAECNLPIIIIIPMPGQAELRAAVLPVLFCLVLFDRLD